MSYREIKLETESDVEQKFIYQLLTAEEPFGLGFADRDFVTKKSIKKIKIDKGNKSKLYYPDYAIVIDGVPLAIIEAKAPGELGEAYREGRLYAAEINSSYPKNSNPCTLIIATDGNILEIGFWDSEHPALTLTLENLVSTDPKFGELLELASYRTLQKNVFEFLKGIKKTARYFKPKHMLGGQSIINETVGDNSFGANVSIEYKYLFNPDTFEDRNAIAENAYVTSKRKLSHVSPIDKIVRSSLPSASKNSTQIENTEKPREIISSLSKHIGSAHEVCLLVGSVGSGKSTFTDYLKLKALPEDIRNQTVWLNLNLNYAPLSREKIYDWTLKSCIARIKDVLPETDFDSLETMLEIYKDDLEKLKKGRAALFSEDSLEYRQLLSEKLADLENDLEKTLDQTISYLKRKFSKTTVIVLDNCDKGNKNDQLLMFEVATWLKKSFSSIVFLPLRDTTYDQYRNVAPLDTVIKDLVFRIDPPLLERVIYERLSFLSRSLSYHSQNFSYTLSNGIRVDCDKSEVERYFKCIITALFQEQFFKRIIVGLAGRNIRKGLEIVLDFCKSGHIPEDLILKIRQSDGHFEIPVNYVSKILFKGNRKYYDDSASYIKSLFHSYVEDALPDPFMRISILELLKSKSREFGPNKIRGFHKIQDLLKTLQQSGHSHQRALSEISVLADAGCIYTESQDSHVADDDLISIAPSGFIHLDLLKNIYYLSAISEDTFFRENQVAAGIKDNIIGNGKFSVSSRQTAILNSKLLLDYMIKYKERFFVGSVPVLKESDIAHLDKFSEVFNYVQLIANNDVKLNEVFELERLYPIGSVHEGQVVSVQNAGLIVEFSLNGSGWVHKSNFNGSLCFDDMENGDWLSVEIIDYNNKHGRFQLRAFD
ncbi:type I restriction endonuclease [Glaciecola siphonariae]